MTEATIIRHSISAYPDDALTDYGVQYARKRAKQFRGFDTAITSGKRRAQQTMQALGYRQYSTDSRFNELELSQVNALSPHEYVMQSHQQFPSLVMSTAGVLIEGLVAVADENEGKLLIVSHNLSLSALMKALTGEVESFNYLEGLLLNISSGQIGVVGRV